MIGQTLSHYRIIEKLGEGGMGVVYKAEDTRLKRLVALKMLPPHLPADKTGRARFIQEARAAAVLNHPNVCTVYDVEDQEPPFIVMEYIEGMTLRELIRSTVPGGLSTREVLKIAMQAAGAIQAAHEQGIVHRDIKSDNLMIAKNGRVKVMDFGVAKLKGAAGLTRTGRMTGTIAYASPEQLQGAEADARSDVFSFGVMLYEMLTGKLPFHGDYESAVIYSILNENPELLQRPDSGHNSAWDRILKRALEKDPEKRYPSMKALMIDLKALKSGALRSIGMKAVQRGKKHSWTVISLLMILLAVLSLLIFKILPLHRLASRQTVSIAVIRFENLSGDPSYQYLEKVIPSLLITDLEQSRSLRVMTWERMADLLRQTGQKTPENIDKETGFQLCRLDSVDAIVVGSVSKAGGLFITDVKVLDVQDKHLIKSVRTQGEGVSSIIRSQVDFLSREISRGIGLSEKNISATQRPVFDVTTQSIEAYHCFVKGKEESNRKYFREALAQFKKAVALDSTFAIAYAWLADTYDNLGYQRERNEVLVKASRFAEKATLKERYFIQFLTASKLEGQPEEAEKILHKAVQRFPREKWFHFRLGVIYRLTRRFEPAISQFNQVLTLDPENGPALNESAYIYFGLRDYERAMTFFKRYAAVSPGNADPLDSMGELYFAMGKLDEALEKYGEAVRIKTDYPAYWKIAYIYALNEDYETALDRIHRYSLNCPAPRDQYIAFLWRVFYNGWLGRFHRAFQLISEREKTLTDHESASLLWITGWLHLQSGHFEKARAYFNRSSSARIKTQPHLMSSHQADNLFMLGLTDLRSGEIDSAKSKLYLFEELLPAIQSSELQRIRLELQYLQEEVMLAEKHTLRIITSRHTAPVPSGSRLLSWTSLYNNAVFNRDVLARAYRINGEPQGAISVYENLTSFNASGESRNLIPPLYHYHLARLYEETGKPEKAVEAYEHFLKLWGDADEDIPEPGIAKKHIEILRRFISLSR